MITLKIVPKLRKLDGLLKKWEPSKSYYYEKDYVKDLFRYLKPKLSDKIEQRKTKRKKGKRYEDLLYSRIYPIEVKTNLSFKEYNELRTQIDDYINKKSHINPKKLTILDKLQLFLGWIFPIDSFLEIKLFVVICGIKNQKLLEELRQTWENIGRVKFYIIKRNLPISKSRKKRKFSK